MSALVMVVAAVAWVAHTYGMVAAFAVTAFVASSSVLGDTESWGLILGVLTPLIVSVVQQPRWSETVRSIVGVIAAIVVGAITCLANGTLDDGSTLLTTIAVVFVASATAYESFWKRTGVAPAIEAKTSPASEHPVAQRRAERRATRRTGTY